MIFMIRNITVPCIIFSNTAACTWRCRSGRCLREGWGEIDHHILYPYKKQNPMLTEFSELLNRLAGMGDEMASFYRRLQDVPGDAFLDKKSMVDVRREYETHETQVGCVELEKIETVQDAIDSILAE